MKTHLKKLLLCALSIVFSASLIAQEVGELSEVIKIPIKSTTQRGGYVGQSSGYEQIGRLIPGEGDQFYNVYQETDECKIASFDGSMKMLAGKEFKFGEDTHQSCLGVVRLKNGIGIVFTDFDKKTKESTVKLHKLDPKTLLIKETVNILTVADKLYVFGEFEAINTTARCTMDQSDDWSKIAVFVSPERKAYDKASPTLAVIDDTGAPVWSGIFETEYIPYAFREVDIVVANDASVYASVFRVDKTHNEYDGAYSIFGFDREGKKMQEIDLKNNKDIKIYRVRMGALQNGAMMAYIISNAGMLILGTDANTGEMLTSMKFEPDMKEWKANAWYRVDKTTEVSMYFPAFDIFETSNGEIYILGQQYSYQRYDASLSILVTKLKADYSVEWVRFLPRVLWDGQIGRYSGVDAKLVNDQVHLFYSFIDPSKLDFPLFEDGEMTKKLEVYETAMGQTNVKPKPGIPMSEFLQVKISADGVPTYNTLRNNAFTIDGIYPVDMKDTAPGVVASSCIRTQNYYMFIQYDSFNPYDAKDTQMRFWRIPVGQ